MRVDIKQHLEQPKIQLKNYNQKNKFHFFFYQMVKIQIVMPIKMVKQILLILQNKQKFQFINLYLITINNKLTIIPHQWQFLKKNLRSIAGTIKDDFIKKYVLEFFLEKISS